MLVTGKFPILNVRVLLLHIQSKKKKKTKHIVYRVTSQSTWCHTFKETSADTSSLAEGGPWSLLLSLLEKMISMITVNKWMLYAAFNKNVASYYTHQQERHSIPQ